MKRRKGAWEITKLNQLGLFFTSPPLHLFTSSIFSRLTFSIIGAIMILEAFMKKALILVLLIGAGFTACKENSGAEGELVPLAKEFVDVLANRDFNRTPDYFDAKMNEVLPPAKVEEAWNMVEGKVGKYKQQLKARQVKEAGFDVVYVTCEFEKSKMNVKVVFDTNKKISGLWFR